MILKHFELKNNLQKKINFYLLYGPNTGLIEEKIDTVFKPAFSKNVRQYEESDVLINQDSFKEEIFNKSSKDIVLSELFMLKSLYLELTS